MTKIENVSYTPAGESFDGALGETLWSNHDAIGRLAELWGEEAGERLGGVPVSIATRSEFVNASRLQVRYSDDATFSEREDLEREVRDALDDAFSAAAERVVAEFEPAA
jgi:hypothetical protein